MEQYIGYLKTGVLVCNIIFFVLLVLSFFIGFGKGWKKATRGLISTSAAIIVTFIFLDVVMNIVLSTNPGFIIDALRNMGLEVPFEGASIQDLLANALGEALNNGEPLPKDSAMVELVCSVIKAFVRLSVFYTLFFASLVIIKIPVAIIVRIVCGKAEGRKGIVSRVVGGAIRLTGFVVVFIILFFPYYGLLTTISNAKEKAQVIIEQVEAIENNNTTAETSIDNLLLEDTSISDNETLKTALEIFEILNNSAVKKTINTCGKAFKTDFDANYLGYMIRIKTENGTINPIKEFNVLIKNVNIEGDYVDENGEIDYIGIVVSQKDLLVNFFKTSEIFETLIPVVIEVIEYNIDLEAYNISLDTIKSIEWKDEKVAISGIIGSAIDFVAKTDLDIEDPIKIIESDKFVEAVKQIGISLGESELFTKVVMVTANDLLKEEFKDNEDFKDYQELLEIVDLSKMNNWGNDFEALAEVVVSLKQIGVFDNDVKFNNSDAITTLIKAPFKLSLISGNEEKLFNELLKITEVDKKLLEIGITLDLSNINWQNESEALASIIVNIFKLSDDITNLKFEEVLSDPTKKEDTLVLLNSLFESEVLNRVVINLLDYIFTSFKLEEWKSEWFINAVNNGANTEEVKVEMQNLVEVFAVAQDIFGEGVDIDITSFDEEKINKLIDLLQSFNNSKLFNINPIISYLNDALKTVNFNGDPENPLQIVKTSLTQNEWNSELEVLNNVLINLIKVMNLEEGEDFDLQALLADADNTKKASVTALLESLFESNLFGDIIVDVIDSILTSANLDDWKSAWFKDVVNGVIPTIEMKDEVAKFVEVISDAQALISSDTLNIDLSSSDNNEINALESLLISLNDTKIFTLNPIVTYIENALVAMNIKDQLGNPIDLPDASLSKNEWNLEIQAIVKIAKCFTQISDIESTDLRNNATSLGDLLNAIDDSKILSPIRNDILSNILNTLGYDIDLTKIDLTNVDWNKEVTTIIDIMDAYSTLDTTAAALESLNNLEQLMLKASESRIATYAFGTVINQQIITLYGAKGAALVPGRFDFTNQTVLASNAKQFANIVKFGQNVSLIIQSSNPYEDDVMLAAASLSALKVTRTSDSHGIIQPTFTDIFMAAVLTYATGSNQEITPEQLAISTTKVNYEDEGSDMMTAYLDLTSNDPSRMMQGTLILNETIIAKIIIQAMVL